MLFEALVSLLVTSSCLFLFLSIHWVLVSQLFQVFIGDISIARKLVLGLLEEIGHCFALLLVDSSLIRRGGFDSCGYVA